MMPFSGLKPSSSVPAPFCSAKPSEFRNTLPDEQIEDFEAQMPGLLPEMKDGRVIRRMNVKNELKSAKLFTVPATRD